MIKNGTRQSLGWSEAEVQVEQRQKPKQRASAITTASAPQVEHDAPRLARPWEVARWGRLLTGVSVGLCTVLALAHDPLWLIGDLLIAFNLFLTSLTGRCPLNVLLIYLGAQEREDLFFPGGDRRL